MTGNVPDGSAFREGDEVVLSKGTYQGALGVFVGFKTDASWADIKERDGRIRSHPVAWLDHFPGAARFAGLAPVRETA